MSGMATENSSLLNVLPRLNKIFNQGCGVCLVIVCVCSYCVHVSRFGVCLIIVCSYGMCVMCI